MKRMIKKTAAVLLAVLMLAQIGSATGASYSSGTIVGSPAGFKEALEIVAAKGTYVLVGQTLELGVNEDYVVTWKSDNEAIATVDQDGIVTAVAEGTVRIAAETDRQKTRIEITVIDPDPLMEDAQEAAANDGTPETQAPAAGNPTEAPAEKQFIVIVINGENSRYVYDGEEHVLDTFAATSNQDFFDESRIRVNREIGVRATRCGTYQLVLDESDFSYDDPNVVASFVVNSGWMKITPAHVTVAANPAEKHAGEEDPELTATVTGLIGNDTLAYTLERRPGEEPGEYVIEATGEEKQGNYKVQFIPGVLTIDEAAAEPEPLTVSVYSMHPADEPVEYGMEITLAAEVTGAEEGEYTIQWQYSTDMTNWTDIPGANGLTYTFTANGETVTYAWRAVADRIR